MPFYERGSGTILPGFTYIDHEVYSTIGDIIRYNNIRDISGMNRARIRLKSLTHDVYMQSVSRPVAQIMREEGPIWYLNRNRGK